MVKSKLANSFLAAIITLLALTAQPHCIADEFPITNNSTVFGRNFGLPIPIEFLADGRPGDIDLVLEATIFGKNLELSGFPDNSINGETYFGSITPIRFLYKASEIVQVELGAVFGQDYGDDFGVETDPLLRLVVQSHPSQYLIGGTLLRTHWIHDALYDDVFALSVDQETGFQYRLDLPNLKQDFWIDWRIKETEIRAEQFEGAGTSQLRLNQFYFDTQFYWTHVGGQKNTSGRVENDATYLVGASHGFDIGSAQSRTGADYLFSHYSDGTVKANGSGLEVWSRIDLILAEQNHLRLFARYFDGNQFDARRGDPLYKFDTYAQFGFNLITEFDGNLSIESGFTAQRVEGTWMNTYQIYFVWHERLKLLRGSLLVPNEPNAVQTSSD